MRQTSWTVEAVRDLGLTTDIETAASILGIGRSKAYALAKEGDFPVRIIRVGRSYLVPVPAILELLGVPLVISATVK
ncbi:helix-turn-helix domain-containing protein [Actinoplanes hulinensis]|uniref:Helix-turn-helix domain-containing protein n=1 Tax=Actinoplanes hulinensis TaxID=1144547 RepID=A0ABS7AWD9_9ACTN|nr:helix-turn-helix domain-containing protein [Actinoplanes hulinensis]MBW6433076.1 helix-turn-helix domain-containing protein [Actinoplanes hulinensis]